MDGVFKALPVLFVIGRVGGGQLQRKGGNVLFVAGVVAQGASEKGVVLDTVAFGFLAHLDKKLVGPGADIPPLNKIGGAVVVEHGQRGVDGDDFVGLVAFDEVDLKNGLGFTHGLFAGIAALLSLVAVAPVFDGVEVKVLGGEVSVDVDTVGVGSAGAGFEKRVGIDDGGDGDDAIFEGGRLFRSNAVEIVDDIEAKFNGSDLVPMDSAENEGTVFGLDVSLDSVSFPDQGASFDGFADVVPVLLMASALPPLISFKICLDDLAERIKIFAMNGRFLLGRGRRRGGHGPRASQK